MEQELGLIFPRWDSDRIWGWQILDPAWRKEIKREKESPSHRYNCFFLSITRSTVSKYKDGSSPEFSRSPFTSHSKGSSVIGLPGLSRPVGTV